MRSTSTLVDRAFVWHHRVVTHVRRGRGGQQGKLWLDFDEVSWLWSERSRGGDALAAAIVPEPPAFVLAGGPAFAGAGAPAALASPTAPTLTLPRPGWSRERKRRLVSRFAPAALLTATVSGAAFWALAGMPALRAGEPAQARANGPVTAAPVVAVEPTPSVPGTAAIPRSAPATSEAIPATPAPEIAWHSSKAVGLPHAGRLVRGVQLPLEGPGWVTWDPARDRSPNRVTRLWGTDGLVRTVLAVIADYSAAHPNAPALVVGDISRRNGGEIDEHASHENGLDIDVYYPRRDGKLRPPSRVSQIDRALAQDLVDRFVAAGAQVLFVGPSTGLSGPADVVVPYPNHNDHVHVRLARSDA